ncbi:MAG: transglutaminase domain-containing protein [bacterium]|nr:transglutaminase domain-containing protein [bacterium]
MKILVMLLCFIFPLREVVDVQITIPTQQHDIFYNYTNDNFSQRIFYGGTGKEMTAHIKNSNFYALNLNFRVFPNKKLIQRLHPELQDIIANLLDNGITFESYFKKVSLFLAGGISYSGLDLPQDTYSVMVNKKADCVGYANLFQTLMDTVGIKNRVIKGFYLKDSEETALSLIPIPHRWVEISLPNNTNFFYDPQHQRFSANYIAIREGVDFKAVKKFKVSIIKKSKKIVNQ